MHLTLPFLAFVFTALPVQIAAQQSPSSALDAFPDCAAICIAGTLQAPDAPCAPTNQTCICTDAEFQASVTACVKKSCNIPEQLSTQNATLTSCGAPTRDRSQQLIVVSDTMAALAAFFILVRFAHKVFFMKLSFSMDDWFILAAMIVSAPSAVITVYGTTANGLGKDIWTLSSDQISKVLMYFYIMAVTYFLQTTFVKLSILAFYMRIFPARGTQRLLWGTFAFTSVWGFAYVFATIFQCRPISYFWTEWDGLHKGECLDANAIAWSNAAINIALDLWSLAIPLWELRKLQLHWKKKIGVALMFCVGTFVTVMSVLRLRSLITFANNTNATWEFYDVALWSTIEICVGIMCACLPTVRLLLVKLFPMLAGSTNRFTGSYASAKKSGLSRKGNSAQVSSTHRPDSAPYAKYADGRPGIAMHKSYTVQYSESLDNDEASLVQMSDLSRRDNRI